MSCRPLSSADPESIDERFYALMTTQITAFAVFVVNDQGCIVTWNAGVEKIIGYQRDEFVGLPFNSLFTAKDILTNQPKEELSRAYRDGMSDDVRWHVRKDGSLFWCDGVLYALKNTEGEFLGYAKIMRDATARRESEIALQRILGQSARRAAQLNAILANMPDAVYVGDESGISECNERAYTMLGLKRKEDLQQSVAELAETTRTSFANTNEPVPFEALPFVKALHGEESVEELSMRRLDTGEELVVRCSAAPVRVEGNVIGAVAVNADITHEKLIEREREELLLALRRSNEELSQFAYVVSHDLQAPLRAVTGFTQLLQRRYENKLDADAQFLISSILEGTQNMNQLIHAVLQYARAGQQSPALQLVGLGAVVDAVKLTLTDEIRETGAQIVCLTDMPAVETDWVQILQVFQNLISNALRFRRPDVPPHIKISSCTEEAEWVVSIEDNGIGIDAAYFERIFEPLKRLHGREIPGTGIGLAICRKVLERFGGRIWVESEPGVGSKFSFTLPR